jgi:hypothetical protein
VNAELRVTANEQMHVIGQDNLQPLVYRWHEHVAPVLRAEDDVLPADVDDVVVAAHVSHAGSMT